MRGQKLLPETPPLVCEEAQEQADKLCGSATPVEPTLGLCTKEPLQFTGTSGAQASGRCIGGLYALGSHFGTGRSVPVRPCQNEGQSAARNTPHSGLSGGVLSTALGHLSCIDGHILASQTPQFEGRLFVASTGRAARADWTTSCELGRPQPIQNYALGTTTPILQSRAAPARLPVHPFGRQR